MHTFQARKLIAMSCPLEFSTGEHIIKFGNKGDEIFVLLSGQVDVFIPTKIGEKFIETLEPGAVFGEIAMIGQVTRTANVRASKTAEVLCLKKNELQQLNRYLPRTASKLYFNISQILANLLLSGCDCHKIPLIDHTLSSHFDTNPGVLYQ